MLSRRFSLFMLLVPLLPLAFAAAWLAWRWDMLPDSIVLGLGKIPGTGTTRAEFARKLVFFVGGIGVLFSGCAAFTASWRRSCEFLRVPDRAYWLAPERRASTLARTVVFVAVSGFAFASAVALSFVIVGEAALAGRSAVLFGTRTPILVGVLGLAAYGWYYRPFVVRHYTQRRSTR